ncbi:MAG: transposase [Ignavibacteriales bacterium]|nr:MAG: transposase [Ignavibacteriales bacterium]
MSLRHRNSLTECSIFFVTTTVINFLNVFKNPAACDILIHNIRHYQKRYNFRILAYVIMPSHFHWIVEVDRTKGTISDLMRDIKKYSAWDIMEHLTKTNYESLHQFKEAAKEIIDQKRKFWMKRFHDEVIRNEKMFWTKLHYIHNNPVEAGLSQRATDYKYSSARNYIGDQSVIFVDTEYAGIEIK